MKLLYLKNRQIDLVKWDRCINNAYNGNVYAFSWYLNITCPNWEALVYDNYKAVFPLPVSTKFGIPVIFHPRLCGQLGIYSIEKLDKRLISLFLERIPFRFKKVNIKLNKFINLDKCDFNIHNHNTYVIDLIRNTNSIYNEYSSELRSIIDHTLQSKLTVINALKPSEVVNFLKNTNNNTNRNIKAEECSQIRKILTCILNNNLGSIHGVYLENNTLCAIGILLFSHNKISIPILTASSEGIKKNAIQLLLHSIIFNNVEKNITLAYEETQNKYYTDILSSFGAEQKSFKEISKLRLIWPINKLLS